MCGIEEASADPLLDSIVPSCPVCVAGKFETGVQQEQCRSDVHQCPDGTFEVAGPTPTSDRVCASPPAVTGFCANVPYTEMSPAVRIVGSALTVTLMSDTAAAWQDASAQGWGSA